MLKYHHFDSDAVSRLDRSQRKKLNYFQFPLQVPKEL